MPFLAYLIALFLPLPLWANGYFSKLSLDEWLEQEQPIAIHKLEQNISPPGTKSGVVIASPQRENPDYFFHWVRDSALTMDVVRQLALKSNPSHWEQKLRNYTAFSRLNQISDALTGLGEPKFYVNGSPFDGAWGRPQNDGPALRAATLTHWANTLLNRGESTYVQTWLYDAKLPAHTVIKNDLEYISQHWKDSSFDLWEEIKADHFYTRLTQWKALTEGAILADRLNDGGAAIWYRHNANQISKDLELFWNANLGQIDSSRNYREGLDYKYSNLDISVILAVLHAPSNEFAVDNLAVQLTMKKLSQAFANAYEINKRSEAPGIALGRYTEDRYSGTTLPIGNPWVLTTLAGAEFYYRLARLEKSPKEKTALIALGDSFMETVKYHANADGSLSEQINRETGFMTSARDLTWNYAAFLTALWAREQTLKTSTLSRGQK